MPQRGEVVLARFPFTDMSGARLRPFLVLAEIPGRYRDFIVLFISSQLSQATPGLDLVLDPSYSAFAGSGLKVPSVFRIGKVASMSEALLAGPLGRLEAGVFQEVIHRLSSLLETGRPPAPAGLHP